MPSDVQKAGGGMSLTVEDTETGEVKVISPELVVLSVGLGPATDAAAVAGRLGITAEDTGFFKTLNDAVDTVATIKPGIYVAGTATAPRDIPDTVTQGGTAAMRAFLDAVRMRSA
jgi:heterodisulfide reductase subunit A